jgi:site-specific DNA recombinase
MKAIGYCRVSTNEQSKEGCSLQNQREKLAAYAMLNDIDLVEIIEDAGISAKNLNREGIQRVIELSKTKKIDAVIVYKLDRLSRSVKDTINIIELFKKYDVAFHAVVDKIDTSSATGKFFLHIMSALSELERGLISERTADCLQAKVKRGERVGAVPFGYNLDSNGIKLIENPIEQQAIKYIQELRGKGYTYRRICLELNAKGYQAKRGSWHSQKIINIIQYQRRITA